MVQTPNLELDYLQAAQAQKHVTHNEALRALDALVQISVVSRGLATPPSSPVDGERYLVGATATDAWVGEEEKIAAWQDESWEIYTPRDGWIVWVEDEAQAIVRHDGAWQDLSPSINPAALVGVNTTADATNRLSVASSASLFTHAGASHQQKINKAGTGDTASQIYQSSFSGRAEIGLIGDDDFHFKVSPDGSTFHEGILIAKDSGRVDLPANPKFSATTNYENYVAANTWTKIAFNVAHHNDQGDFDAGNNRLIAPVDGYYMVGMKWRFKANASVPASIQSKFYKNGAAENQTAVESWGTVVTERTHLVTFDLLKLTAADYVEVFAFMETNDGYVDDDGALFWGVRVA